MRELNVDKYGKDVPYIDNSDLDTIYCAGDWQNAWSLVGFCKFITTAAKIIIL